MKYEVIHHFKDALDGNHDYPLGSTYPRDGLTPSEQRINDLLKGNNKIKTSVIKPLKSEKVEKAVEETDEPKKAVWTADDINKMPFMKLKSVAKQNGVEVEDKKASEIKEELIKKLVEV